MDEQYAILVASRFGPRLRELRTKAGISQAELGRRSGIRQASIAEYERAVSAPTWPYVVRLALALGATPDAFTIAATEQTSASDRNSD